MKTKEEKVLVGFQINKKMLDIFKEKLDSDSMTISEFLRVSVRNYINSKKEEE